MKVIIAGSRNINRVDIVGVIAASGLEITEVVSGGCQGVDKMGEEWAAAQGIPVKLFLPDWNAYGKAAGPIRNRQMANYADALIAVWDGKSRGTGSMINLARDKGLKIFIRESI